MKIEKQMIAKELRIAGAIYGRILPGFCNKKYKSTKYINHGMRNNVYLKRSDDTYLRIKVMKSKKCLEAKRSTTKVPGILWIHGGGYSVGAPEMAYFSMPKLMMKSQACVIIAPEYTLSVDKPYPAAFQDCCRALLWMNQHADTLGISREQIFVGGESAGGGLTAAVCLWARNTGTVKIAYQMPLYPMLDDRMESDSMKNNNAPVWNERLNCDGWALYLKDRNRDSLPSYASPARAKNYKNLPPAISFVGSVDPFKDETVMYIEALKRAGVEVEFKVFEGCFHAFDMLVPWSLQAKEARAFFMECFTRACKNAAIGLAHE